MASLTGKTLGKYQIIERIGRGGMANVYKARHPRLNAYFAIKVLHENLVEGPEFLARFEREARTAASLRHPNIVRVFDFDVEDGNYYMVMELIQGGTLKDRLDELTRQGSFLAFTDALDILRQVGGALDYAHQQGMLHRDIKPTNIMLETGGCVYLADFGIVHIVSDTQFTSTGALIGTPAYMSPEQCRGGQIDVPSDIFSLGMVLYEMVTGRTPYIEDTPLAVIHKQLYEPLPPPSKFRPDLPLEIEQVIVQALSKEPAARFGSAAGLASAFEHALQRVHSRDTQVAAQMPSPPETAVAVQAEAMTVPLSSDALADQPPAPDQPPQAAVGIPALPADQGIPQATPPEMQAEVEQLKIPELPIIQSQPEPEKVAVEMQVTQPQLEQPETIHSQSTQVMEDELQPPEALVQPAPQPEAGAARSTAPVRKRKSRWARLWLILLALPVLLVVGLNHWGAFPYSQDFERGLPANWSLGPCWMLSRVGGTQALRGQGHCFTRPVIPTRANFILRLRIRFTPGSALHVNVRENTAKDMRTHQRYFIGLTADQYYLTKQNGESFWDLASSSWHVDGWQTIRIEVRGNIISVYQETGDFSSPQGYLLMRARDDNPYTRGRISFESLTDSPVWIDDLQLTPIYW